MLKASLHTLGCRLNQAETAIIARKLQNHGFDLVPFGEQADLTVINTCTVTAEADAKCRQAVRKSIRRNPETFVAVVGCYSQTGSETIKQIDGVDLIIGNQHKFDLLDYLDTLRKKETPLIINPRISREPFRIDHEGLFEWNTRANLKIQDGCNFVCSFCIIAKARGPARSREFNDIMREAKQLVDAGHKEIVITGVNVGTYLNGEKRFVDVLKALESIDDLKRIRISSIEPRTVNKELIDLIADSDKICRYLHIPLQSGDDEILRSMRRKHTASDFAQIIEYAAARIPGIGLGTDVMVGYPGEDDKAFKNTKKLLTDLPVSFFHVFTYSDRMGTASYKMHPKVDHHLKKERMHRIMELGKRKRFAYHTDHLDRQVEVLFEDKKESFWTGLTDTYMRVKVPSERALYNRLRPVHLQGIEEDCMTGELV